MKNEKIVKSWDKIEPDEETRQKIFGDIMQKQSRRKKRPRLKNIIIFASIFMTALILMGAAIFIYAEMTYYDFNGNIRDIDIPYHSSSMYEPGTEEYEFENELRNNKEDNAILFIYSQGRSLSFPAYNTISDYEELKNYLKNNDREMFKLPEYIPDGFEFAYAKVYIGLDINSNYEELTPVYYEEKFGNIYEKYIVPENISAIEHVNLYYSNGKIYISCDIGFSVADIDNIVFGSSIPMETSEVLNIPQFERSILTSQKNGFLNPNPMWYLKLVRFIDEPVNLFDGIFISQTWRERQIKEYPDYLANSSEYGSVIYSIDSTSLLITGVSRNDIIKMAESIK